MITVFIDSSGCLKHKFILPLEPITKLYERFTQTSLKKRLLYEIKNNLV
jgi:hypothetical protein